MTVYVDDMMAEFGRMKMCHLIADTTAELLWMVRAIGVDPKWIQKAGEPGEHFDIAMSKRQLAITAGAVPITWMELSRMCLGRRSCDTPLVRAPKPTIAEACHTRLETSGQPTLWGDGE